VEIQLDTTYYAQPRFILLTLGTIATVGLVLVVIGVFSVMAYTVSLRTHEIGIRMALGAQQQKILSMVLSKGMRLVAAGALIGVLTSYALTRFIASQIWGVSPTDPATFAAVVGLVLMVGAAACLIPAMRATKVDPLIALRYE
jgi:putative ABC transport system permease protein